MRFAGVSACSGVMMSFWRRIGAAPSIRRRVRWSPLVTTASPIRMRSPAFSSTFSAIVSLPPPSRAANQADARVEKETGGARPPPFPLFGDPLGLAEQTQHVAVGLRRKRQRSRRQLLAGLQREQVGA